MSNYCKECGKELLKNSNADLCEYHQNKKNGKIRSFLEKALGALGVLGTVVYFVQILIAKGKFGGPKS